jgi:hypothetical protein
VSIGVSASIRTDREETKTQISRKVFRFEKKFFLKCFVQTGREEQREGEGGL